MYKGVTHSKEKGLILSDFNPLEPEINKENIIKITTETFELNNDKKEDLTYVSGNMSDVDVHIKFANGMEFVFRYVIKCKDCRFYGRDKEKGGFCFRMKSPAMWNDETGELKEDDFCSYAERRKTVEKKDISNANE